MSTRSTTHFIYAGHKKPTAIIYRHSDGYPEGAGVDIQRFLDECAKLSDSRFSDPSYLAAKYVVFLADMFNTGFQYEGDDLIEKRYESKLQFLSVGVLDSDPGDIEYRYVIECSSGRPKVTCYHITEKYSEENGRYKSQPQSRWKLVETPIPASTEVKP